MRAWRLTVLCWRSVWWRDVLLQPLQSYCFLYQPGYSAGKQKSSEYFINHSTIWVKHTEQLNPIHLNTHNKHTNWLTVSNRALSWTGYLLICFWRLRIRKKALWSGSHWEKRPPIAPESKCPSNLVFVDCVRAGVEHEPAKQQLRLCCLRHQFNEGELMR